MKLHTIIFTLFCMLFSSCSNAQPQEIKASEIVKALKKGKNVEYANKIILDDLNFTDAEHLQMFNKSQLQAVVTGNVFFSNCVFMGAVSANGTHKVSDKSLAVQTKFENNLIFDNCDFRGEVNFDNAVVQGNVHFIQSKFREQASFNNMTIWSKNANFSEVLCEKDFIMVFTNVYGNLTLNDAKFQQTLSLQETNIHGNLFASSIYVTGYADFSLLSVQGRSMFTYAKAEIGSFEKAIFVNEADFRNDSISIDHSNATFLQGKLTTQNQ